MFCFETWRGGAESFSSDDEQELVATSCGTERCPAFGGTASPGRENHERRRMIISDHLCEAQVYREFCAM